MMGVNRIDGDGMGGKSIDGIAGAAIAPVEQTIIEAIRARTVRNLFIWISFTDTL
jgi:hypothetical protein